jgi:6-carboxyhexanoate--CoA ligase
LSEAGLSREVIERGIRIAAGNEVMRGASLIRSVSGIRAEPDTLRGVRVSRLGIERSSERRLSRGLARGGINTSTVKEAVVLASKVASCGGVVAELCISDDPHYTTGYVASAGLGYVRVTKIKDPGSMSGGRIFFVEEKADVSPIIDYLEKIPVIATLPPRDRVSR